MLNIDAIPKDALIMVALVGFVFIVIVGLLTNYD